MLRLRTIFIFLCLHNCFALYIKNNEVNSIEDDSNEVPGTGLDIVAVTNPEKTEEGDPIIQGDIVLPPGKTAEDLKGMINPTTFWPNGKISYNFHKSVDDDLKEMIRGGIAEWEKHSCLKFKEKNMDYNFLRFRADKKGCWSMIGRMNTPFTAQDVSIGNRCNRTYIIVHEIGHALGFYHEQSRNDRDGYIHIVWENVGEGKSSQFDKGIESPRGVEYDYGSVMHYPPMSFSSKYYSKNTITALNPHHQTLIGAGYKISHRDAKLINMMYSCSNKCPNKNETICQNDGFLSPYRDDKQPCHCVCPPRTSGELCENKEEPYSYYDMPPCGGNVTEETTIETPGYPKRGPEKDSCSWWIQAPEGKRVKIEFLDFSFHPRSPSNITMYHMKCKFERVEIRTRYRYNGDMFCGEDIPPGTVAYSAQNELIIIIDSNEKSMEGSRGLKAKVTFVDSAETEGEGNGGNGTENENGNEEGQENETGEEALTEVPPELGGPEPEPEPEGNSEKYRA